MSGWGMACCPTCGDVLMMTFEKPYKEFHCITCRSWWEFLQPVAKDETPELLDRWAEVKLQFQNECRHMPHVVPCGVLGGFILNQDECACGCRGDDYWCGQGLAEVLCNLLLT